MEIPADTVVIANLWAVSRDPNHWIEPSKFNPGANFPLDKVEPEEEKSAACSGVYAICTMKTNITTLFLNNKVSQYTEHLLHMDILIIIESFSLRF